MSQNSFYGKKSFSAIFRHIDLKWTHVLESLLVTLDSPKIYSLGACIAEVCRKHSKLTSLTTYMFYVDTLKTTFFEFGVPLTT